MNFRRLISISLSTLFLACACLPCDGGDAVPVAKTALDEYVHAPDSSYRWKVAKTIPGEGYKVFIVDLTSQSWRQKGEVNRTLWQHWLTVVKPDKIITNKAFLMIGGGRNGRDRIPKPDQMIVKMALASNSVVASLGMVPNQSLVFHGDGEERVEDDLVGYTWDQFLKTGDKNWPARNPMIKSAVRAMDAITELMAGDEGGKLKVDQFVVAGASKRGWTTWLTGALDQRVVAIIPIVIDVLNVNVSMTHHFHAYGFWAPAVGNYLQHKIMQRMNDPMLKELYQLVDPYYYRHRLTMPKYIVNAAGDQFFLPDSSRFYFDDLVGEKYLRYVPNTDHSLRGSDAIEAVLAYYQMIIHDAPRPKFSWEFAKDGSIRVNAANPPKTVTLWQATNPAARDFRLETLGKKYTSSELKANGKGNYVGRIKEPAKGWTAFFVEMNYDTGTALPLKFTTAVRVLPDTLPHAGMDPTKGKLGAIPERH